VVECRLVVPRQLITGTYASPGCGPLWITASADAVKLTGIGRSCVRA
jgi:hypothetical protein